MKRPALARIESGTAGKTRKDTLARLAHVMGLNREQLDLGWYLRRDPWNLPCNNSPLQ